MPADDPAPVDPAIRAATAQATLVKLQAEARKASAEAGTAEVAARGGALKAAIGEVAASGLSGSVTTSDGAGLAEGNAQAIAALGTVGKRIAEKIAAVDAARILLVLGTAAPSTAAATAFDFEERLVARTLDDALAATAVPSHAVEHRVTFGEDRMTLIEGVGAAAGLGAAALGGPVLTTVGLGLSGLNAVLGYARTDVTLGGREVKPHDRALLAAIAAGLVAPGRRVRLDGAASPVDHATITRLTARIEKLAASAAEVRARAADYAAKIARGSAKPTPPGDDAASGGKPPAAHHPDPNVPLYQRALAVLDAALATFDAFYASLLHDDGTGPFVVRIAQAIELDHFVRGGAVALGSLDGAWSSTLSKKNLLTGLLGRVPYEVNAFVTASWQLIDGGTAEVVAAGVESELLPYRNLLDIA